MGERRGAYRGLVEKHEGKGPTGRPRGWGGMEWIVLAQDRDRWRALVNTVMSLGVP